MAPALEIMATNPTIAIGPLISHQFDYMAFINGFTNNLVVYPPMAFSHGFSIAVTEPESRVLVSEEGSAILYYLMELGLTDVAVVASDKSDSIFIFEYLISESKALNISIKCSETIAGKNKPSRLIECIRSSAAPIQALVVLTHSFLFSDLLKWVNHTVIGYDLVYLLGGPHTTSGDSDQCFINLIEASFFVQKKKKPALQFRAEMSGRMHSQSP